MEQILEIGNLYTSDKKVELIANKVLKGERLSFEDGVDLFSTNDIHSLGLLADYKKRKVSGDKVYFVLNRHVNPTNICVLSCNFCDFAKKKGDSDAYEMSIDEILNSIDEEMHEVHIVGGHHPTWKFEYYEEMIKSIHSKYPDIQIKGFTAAEIDYFHRRWKIDPEESIARLKEAGLSSMPGGGAEVFSSRVHKMLLPGKSTSSRWQEIHSIAHSQGIKSNCTMLYGHIETIEERVDHFIQLRELQDETNGFLAFIPLQYQTGTTQLTENPATPIDDLKMISIARLMLDNIDHIKSYWVTIGEETASIGLNFGADDLDGTIKKENIMHAAKAKSPGGLAREKMIYLIKEARKVPVERNALYSELKVYED
jgi:aminodeoxyfutalosine synthase